MARFWAVFTDPRRDEVTCQGFQLRAGLKYEAKTIWTGQYFDKVAVIASLQRSLAKASNPGYRDSLRNALDQTDMRLGGWSFGPPWVPYRNAYDARRQKWNTELLPKYHRAKELAGERVTSFCGASEDEMRAAGRFCGHCAICGKELTDPVSLELGVGPECRRVFGVSVQQAPGPWVIGGCESSGVGIGSNARNRLWRLGE